MSPTPTNTSSGLKTALVAGGLIALVASNVYMYVLLDHTRTDLAKLNDSVRMELSNLKEASSVTTASQRHSVETLKTELEAARQQANQAAGHAKQEAQAHADQLAKQLADQQAQQHAQVQSDLNDVKTQATTANAKIGEVSGDVSNVKTEVASTKEELAKTVANLNKTIGDLGVQSGYIATNGKELEALKKLNERNYFEFTLTRKEKQPHRVGDIALQLKSADVKHHKYTLEVLADDKMVEKKDKGLNEPLQFIVSKAGQPYELVVNDVKKDQVTGYLATPKVTTPRP